MGSFLTAQDLSDEEAVRTLERARFNTMVWISLFTAVVASYPMFGYSIPMAVILMLAYMPVFALVYIGTSSKKWSAYFGALSPFAMGGVFVVFLLLGMQVARQVMTAFHLSSGM